METKVCTKCGEAKPTIEFYFRSDTSSYRADCKDCIKKAKAIRESKPGVKELRAIKEKERRVTHKDSINSILRIQRSTEEGKARLRANFNRLKQKNPEKVKAWSVASHHNRKELKKANGSIDSAKDITTWVLAASKYCSYCGVSCSNNYQVDHIDPLTKGGTHTIDNLTIACPACNNSKHNHTLLVWLAKKKKDKQ